MKFKLLILFLLIGLVSCSKEYIEPINEIQVVTYDVKCKHCLIYYTDSLGNTQTERIEGNWNYSFENKNGLDTVNIEVYVSQLTYDTQHVVLHAYTNDGRKDRYSFPMGLPKYWVVNGIYQEGVYEAYVMLPLIGEIMPWNKK